ncbi:hypothetical protein NW768_003939 [Fusarium equiseti]|uniref:Uncharacterized protein n=1 Tax=Fusarium equiseti TaxID=61235 RepID=A0ABQ8RJ35_FUSEQ|nr:hypothetical protein NW768_003939 [Fusarium equiseti]
MSGLPDNWEADYDGRRWFYKYKPTGHVQYHFPKEGDEFPDFIDSFSPVPDLAPEERLESQQQVRRHGSTTTVPAKLSPKKDDGGYGMSAMARPVSMTWDGSYEEEHTVFQPENFMYLGPGTYTDVSPLAEEEEEAAKRAVAGGIDGRFDKSPSKGVSPLNSEKTTPAQSSSHAGPIAEPVLVPPTVVEEIHEMPTHEPPRALDPVGIIAEMPTYDTAQAHIETNPPPIEMADNTVLAPIETAAPMMAELPEKSSPVEKKKDEPQLAPGSLRNYSLPMQPLRTTEETPGIQSYKPEEISPHPAPLRRSTFQPGYMANTSPIQPPDRGHAGTPNVLSPPKVPPKRPLDAPTQPQIPPKHAFDQSSQSSLPSGVANNAPLIPGQEPELSHMPSVLKPARGKGPGQPSSQPVPGPARGSQGHGYVPPMPGKHPASMTPAPIVQQQRLDEPRMGVQRVNTVPDSLPSQKPQSVIQNRQQGMPYNTATRPLMQNRPASVLPDMMGMQPQAQYQSPVECVPPKGLPRSATAGPTTPFPPYPVDNLPYPDDQPSFRREHLPYPEEPFMQKPILPNQDPVSPSPPIQNNRRHSSYSSSMVSPDSRHGSMSFPLQSPSPMEHSRRASTTSNQIPNYTPSPVSQNSTPPSAPANQYQQGSYFHMPDGENQGYNNAARDALRKQSLGRGVDPRRNSAGADPVSAQRGSPLSQQNAQGYNAVSQALPHLQSPPQISQINAVQQNQRPDVAPTPPPQGQQSLGRIEEYEEAPSGTISRSSTTSITSEMRKGSVSSSAQPSPMGSRRASLQSESPRNVPPGQQGHMLQGYTGQPMPQAQTLQGAPMPPQNPKQLQRKPSQGSVPQLQGRQMPTHDPRMAQGMPQQQGPGPQGQPLQMPPPQTQGRPPHPGQINTQVQHPQGPSSSVLPPKPVPTRLQKRSSYGPPSPAGQMAPPNSALQGPLPPSLKAQNQMSGQITPPGQPNVLQKTPTGRVQPHVQIPQDQGSWQPSPHPVMPQNQRPVSMQPQSSQSAGAKEGKEGKKWLKWLKGGSKSVSHSPTTPVISSPISSPVVGRPGWGGEYSQHAVWQPGQPMAAGPQPGPQGNLPPSQSMYMQSQHVQIAPQQTQMQPQPARRASYSFQLAPEPNQMGYHSSQPNQMQMYSEQSAPQAGQLPPQRRYSPPQQGQTPGQQGQTSMQQGQTPPQKRYSPPQQVQTPIQQGQMQTPQSQMRPQPDRLSFQNRLSLQQTPMSERFDNNAPMVAQAPPPGPGPAPRQPEPQGQPTGTPAMTGPPMKMPSNIPEPAIKSFAAIASNSVPRQQPTPPRQPSPGQIRPLQQVPRQQPTPPRQPSPAQIRPLQRVPSPQSKVPEPSQSPQTFTSNHLQHDTVANDVPSPHSLAAVTPGLSEAATPLSRMSSTRSYFSDAGSITTIEVAQAQTQPVLKPSIVQVKRRSTDMLTQSHDVPSSSDATPRISEETKRIGSEPPSSSSSLQQQPTIARPEPTPQVNVPKDNVVAPLFSTPDVPKTVQPDALAKLENKEPAQSLPEQPSSAPTNNFVPDQQNNLVEAKAKEVQPEPAKPAPVVEDKWAKKPVLDYSGGDWGDDDDWNY